MIVYGNSRSSTREELWKSLEAMAEKIRGSWLVLGDFNAFLDPSEKKGGKALDFHNCVNFRGCLMNGGLFDITFTGSPYTWRGQNV